MEHTAGAVLFKCSRIVIHTRARRYRPVCLPESIRKFSHELFSSGRVAPLTLNLQTQNYAKLRPRIHAPRQNLERLRSVKEGVGTRPNRALRRAKKLLIHAPSIASV